MSLFYLAKLKENLQYIMVNMYPFLPRCAVYDRGYGGTVISQKSCVNKLLRKSKVVGGFHG